MAAWLDELQRDEAKWDSPLDNLPLLDDIPKLWTDYAAGIDRKG